MRGRAENDNGKRKRNKRDAGKNLRFLTPWLRDCVQSITDEEMQRKIEVTYNSEGYPICRYHGDGKTFAVTSEQPQKEAERWYSSLPKRGTGAVFLFGCGFGYPLFEIFARKRPHTLVVVFEQDLCLFKAMLSYFDLEPILKTQRIQFLVGDCDFFSKAFDQFFFSIYFISCSYPTCAWTHAARRNFKAEYLTIYKYVFSHLSLLVFYLGNDHKDNLIGLHNLIANTGEILRQPYLSCLKDRYKGFPAFIIANGPSLDKNIAQLKKIQGRGLIFSVESAILPLLKNQIKPDILCVVERTKGTYTCHFQNVDYPKDVSLLCLALVDPRVFPSFPGEKIPIFRSGEAIHEWMNRFLGDGSSLDAGVNVSHLAAELAVYLGAGPVVFVGQDYAYGPQGDTHSKDSVYYEERGKKSRDFIQSKPLLYVEGNNGETVATNQLWVDFRMGLERKIAAHPGQLFLNATEGGAKIEGTRCEPLEQVISKYCGKTIPRRVNEWIAENRKSISFPQRKESLEKYRKSVESYAEAFRTLAGETGKGKQTCRKMIDLSHEKEIEKYYSVMEEAYLNNIVSYNQFITDSLYRCFFQQIVFSYFYRMDYLGIINTPEKITEIFRVQYNFFNCLGKVCQSVSVHMENAAQSLRDELELFEQRVERGEDEQ